VREVDVFSGANASVAILLSGFAGHFVENGEQDVMIAAVRTLMAAQ